MSCAEVGRVALSLRRCALRAGVRFGEELQVAAHGHRVGLEVRSGQSPDARVHGFHLHPKTPHRLRRDVPAPRATGHQPRGREGAEG